MKLAQKLHNLCESALNPFEAFGFEINYEDMAAIQLIGAKKPILSIMYVHKKSLLDFRNTLLTLVQQEGVNLTGMSDADVRKDRVLVDKLIKIKKILLDKSKDYLEELGLGKPPFTYVGAYIAPDKSLQEKNPTAYQNELRNAPKYDSGGVGSCARCWTAIEIHYNIRSQDGKLFPLGSECVRYLNSKKIEDQVTVDVRKLDKEKREKREKIKRDELKDLLSSEENIAVLKNTPSTKPKEYVDWDLGKKDWYDRLYKNEYERIVELEKRSGTAGKIKILKDVKKILGLSK